MVYMRDISAPLVVLLITEDKLNFFKLARLWVRKNTTRADDYGQARLIQ